MKTNNTSIYILIISLAVLMTQGCTTTRVKEKNAVAPRTVDVSSQSRGAGTGIESQDIVSVTDKMARQLLNTPEIRDAVTPPIVALLPVTNDTRFPINTNIFIERIKVLLQSKVSNKVRFVTRDKNRLEAIEHTRELKDQGAITSSKSATMAGEDYFLTGKLMGQSQASSTGRSDYILYTFNLIDTETGIEVFGGFDEIKKEGLEDAIYR
jgi:PBP1b-binding outer membrane lipoprotein LpoB